MGMASSDDEESIAMEYARTQKMRERPRNPNSYEHRASELENAYYSDSLEKWAGELDALDDYEDAQYWAKHDR